jgi:hypothetical protein
MQAWDDLQLEAWKVVQDPYVPPSPMPLPEFDLPQSGIATDMGLVFDEYQAIIDPPNAGKFYDNGVWWLKALPRGNVHRIPLSGPRRKCRPRNHAGMLGRNSGVFGPISRIHFPDRICAGDHLES